MRKKMLKWNEQELNFGFSGLSTQHGIFIRAEEDETRMSMGDLFRRFFSDGYPGAFAHMSENGEIKVHNERGFSLPEKWKMEAEREMKIIQKVRNGFFFAFISLWIVMIPSFMLSKYLPTLLMAIGFICLGCSKIAPIIYQYTIRCFGFEPARQRHRFHSAEHAVINAFYDLKRVPTLDEVKSYSNYSYYCGTTLYFRDAASFLTIGFCRLLPNEWYLMGLLIVLPLVFWFMKKRMYLLEYFTLLEPTDKEYSVAIAALEGALELKSNVDAAKDVFSVLEQDGCPFAHVIIHVE